MYFLFMESLSENIKTLRKSKGWTQSKLAEKLNSNQQAIASYENNTANPPVEKLPVLASIFGVTVDELLGVKEIAIKEEAIRKHGNSRSAKIQEYFDKLSAEEQRTTLKQIKALVESKQRDK